MRIKEGGHHLYIGGSAGEIALLQSLLREQGVLFKRQTSLGLTKSFIVIPASHADTARQFLQQYEKKEQFKILGPEEYARHQKLFLIYVLVAFALGVVLLLAYNTQPRTEKDRILSIVAEDARKNYRDLSSYNVKARFENGKWRVDYELKDPKATGGGPHYVIDAITGAILERNIASKLLVGLVWLTGLAPVRAAENVYP